MNDQDVSALNAFGLRCFDAAGHPVCEPLHTASGSRLLQFAVDNSDELSDLTYVDGDRVVPGMEGVDRVLQYVMGIAADAEQQQTLHIGPMTRALGLGRQYEVHYTPPSAPSASSSATVDNIDDDGTEWGKVLGFLELAHEDATNAYGFGSFVYYVELANDGNSFDIWTVDIADYDDDSLRVFEKPEEVVDDEIEGLHYEVIRDRDGTAVAIKNEFGKSIELTSAGIEIMSNQIYPFQ